MDGFDDKYLKFSKGERIAILIIGVLMVLMLVVCVVAPFRSPITPMGFHPLDSLQAARDRAMQELAEQRMTTQEGAEKYQLTPFPFNPNGLPEEDWKRMGLTDRQIRNIKNYEAKGGKFFTKNDLKKLYTISDEDFAALEPYIILPQTKQANRTKDWNNENAAVPAEPKVIPVVEINSVDSALLTELPKVTPYMAARVVAYRERLGGFMKLEQLLEVKGVDSVKFEALMPYLQLGEAEIVKVDVNRDEFKTLLRHPYLSYEQVKAIVRHRESKGMLKDWEQVRKVVGETEPLNPLMENYIKY